MSTNRNLPTRSFIIFIGLLLTLSWANPASSDPGKRADAEALTRSLVGLNTAYRQASPAARPQALQQLLDVAAERQALLAQLIEDNPGKVVNGPRNWSAATTSASKRSAPRVTRVTSWAAA